MILVAPLHDEIWVVSPEGRIDLAAAGAVEDAFNGLLNEGRARIVVDCSQVSYMASAGLRVLVLTLRRARNLGGDLRLAAANQSVQQVLKMSGMDSIFTLYATVAEAAASLRRGAIEALD